MVDPSTFARGAELGFAGVDFYVAGRGGVLGEVDPDVIVATFGFFEPTMVRDNWAAGCKVMPPLQAAAEFAACGHRFAEEHVPDDVDSARLAELAGRISDAASPVGAPLFAAWRKLDVPSSPKSAALHHLNALRELRGAMHLAGVLSVGMNPKDALLVKSAFMAPIFGWSGPFDDVSHLSDTWQQAEDATNRAVAVTFEVLDESEQAAFVELTRAFHAGMAKR